ncbi:MAG: PDDEXK family nuclease [Candidatus Dormibacteria bacterium]
MKIVKFTVVVDKGPFSSSLARHRVEGDVRRAIDLVRWPVGGPDFTIYPQSGKKPGEGNGVKPIKNGFVKSLAERKWRLEEPFSAKDEVKATALRPGAFDAWCDLGTSAGLVAVAMADSEALARSEPDAEELRHLPFVAEWETGNISSSHRALNKMALAMLEKRLSGGVLVLPTRALYRYLTDRIGNYEEIEPYFRVWASLPIDSGFLAVIGVEHDRTSQQVGRIPKGTDGRANA